MKGSESESESGERAVGSESGQRGAGSEVGERRESTWCKSQNKWSGLSWCDAEDTKLVKMVLLHGSKDWKEKARLLDGRSIQACSDRWRKIKNARSTGEIRRKAGMRYDVSKSRWEWKHGRPKF